MTVEIKVKETKISTKLPPLVENIGNTPLFPLVSKNPEVMIFAKAEWLNPGGSVKDRAARSMIIDAISRDCFHNGRRLLDASSGNTAIAYAMIGAALNIKVSICIPENASKERLQILRAYGTELILTDRMEGTDGAIEVAQELSQERPGEYHYIDQYNNPENWLAHYKTTAPEIIEQTDGKITHFVAGLGTSGTFVGTGRRLKEEVPGVDLISFQPDSPFHGLEGMKHMDTAIRPGIYDDSLADFNITISTKEAYTMTRELAQKYGYLVGISSGAAFIAANKVATEIQSGIVVTIFPDRGDRYLSENIWRKENA